jgi:alpha-L-arabinofuranosidase
MKMKVRFAILLLLTSILPLHAETTEASLEINAGVTLTHFTPLHVFGNNANAWGDPTPVKAKIEKAGNYLIRIPGGSWGDVYHWNSNGTYDKEGHWVPNDTEYSPSKLEKDCTLKFHASRALDGKDDTVWQSNPETDFPDAQWLYVDLAEKTAVDQVQIVWGDVADHAYPYAKVFSVQCWDPKEGRQWMVYGADKDAWIDVKADVKGKGGRQEVKFASTQTQHVRLLLKGSSAGKGGTYTVAEFQVLANGKPVSLASWSPIMASSTSNISAGMDSRDIVGFDKFMDFLGSFTPKAQALVIVNFGSGTPQEAAAWVHYANKVKHYGIQYWEIGNEVGGNWECGGPVNNADYARRYILFYEAMKAEDPTIRIMPNVGATDASQLYDGVACLKTFVDRLAKDKKEKYLDLFSIHQYPNWDQTVPALLESPKTDMASLAVTIKNQLSDYPALADVPVWISEFNTSDHVKPHDISVHIDNGLWLATYLGEFIRNFGPRAFATMWDVTNGGSAINKVDGGDHGYLQAEGGPYQYQERADYWSMTQLTNHWAIPGDDRDHQLVEATCDASSLAVYADARPDGKLSLLVVNKSPENEVKATLKIRGFKPDAKAEAWSFDSTNYKWNTDKEPYHADPDLPPTLHTLKKVSSEFKYTFTPYSITVLQLEPKSR